MKNFKTKIKIISLILIFGFLIFSKNDSLAVDYYEYLGCDEKTGDEKKACEIKADQAEEYEKLIKLKSKQEDNLKDQLADIDNQQLTVTSNLQGVREKYYAVKDEIEQIERDIKEREKTLEHNRKILSGLMQSYYEYDQSINSDLVILDNNLAKVFNFGDQLDQSNDKVVGVLEEIMEAKNKLEEDKEKLEEKKKEHEDAKDALEKENLNLQNTEVQKQALLGKTQAEKSRYESLLDSIENEIYQLESSKSVDYDDIPKAKDGYFKDPVSSVRLTQYYGCLTSYFARKSYPACNNGKGGFHNGLDFGSGGDGNIYAVRKGKVVGKGNNGGYAYGKWIAIDHGDGLVTLYGHLSEQSVSKGESVKAGEKIGKMGTTGYSTGVHLHFSVFYDKSFGVTESSKVDGLMIPNGASVDPRRYLD